MEALPIDAAASNSLARVGRREMLYGFATYGGFVLTLVCMFLYGVVVPAKTQCYFQYAYDWTDYLREILIHGMLVVSIVLFLWNFINGQNASRRPLHNVALFAISCAVVVFLFAMYFYTYGVLYSDFGKKVLMPQAPAESFADIDVVAQNFGHYIYFSAANSIFMAAPEFEYCGALRVGIVLQRLA